MPNGHFEVLEVDGYEVYPDTVVAKDQTDEGVPDATGTAGGRT